jgi:transcription elongation factor GreA
MSTENQIVLTPAGYERFQKELEHLRTVERPSVADRIRESKQFGELTENSEYENAKIAQAFVEGRIRDVERLLQNALLLTEADVPTDEIGLGSIVTVEDVDAGDEWEFQLVSSFESDPNHDRISNESPVGEALLGRRVGDEVDVAVPDGHVRYRVKKIGK